MRNDLADSVPAFSAGGYCEQIWYRQVCLLFDVVHPAFPLPAISTIPQGALRDGLKEAVMVRDMPAPCKFPTLNDNCSLLWSHKDNDLVPHPVSTYGLKLCLNTQSDIRLLLILSAQSTAKTVSG